MDGRPEQKLGCVGESEAEAQTARVGAADGAGNTVSDIWCGMKRGLFFYSPLCINRFVIKMSAFLLLQGKELWKQVLLHLPKKEDGPIHILE